MQRGPLLSNADHTRG